MTINSRNKGARGERELANKLNELFPKIEARRGRQFSGGQDSPDVIAIPGIHVECKRVESLNLGKAMEQSERDCGDNIPTVFHRKNKKPWLVTLRLDDILEFVRAINEVL